VGPYFIDWSDYRDTIEARITAITGLDATITGDLDIRFLPTGRINISGLEIHHDGLPFPMVIVPNLSAEFSLSAFLRGQTEITQVNISQPIVSLPLGADGSLDFGSGPVAEMVRENIAIGAFEVAERPINLGADGETVGRGGQRAVAAAGFSAMAGVPIRVAGVER